MAKVTIDVIGKDGRPVIADLEGASPTGGLVTSAWKLDRDITVGDVIRYRGRWMVAVKTLTFADLGLTRVSVRGPDLKTRRLELFDGMGAEVRTDCGIDPGSLDQLDHLAAA